MYVVWSIIIKAVHVQLVHHKLNFFCITAELKENTTLNSKVWDTTGLRGNGTFPLHYFTYNNTALLNVIFQHLHKTNFSGVTVSGEGS